MSKGKRKEGVENRDSKREQRKKESSQSKDKGHERRQDKGKQDKEYKARQKQPRLPHPRSRPFGRDDYGHVTVIAKTNRAQENEKYSDMFEQEVQERKTYESNIDMREENSDTEELPSPFTSPKEQIPVSPDTDVILFDLETSGLYSECDITQIAAKHHGTEDCFSTFVRLARGYISRGITNITGIEIHKQNMYFNLEKVPSLSTSEALSVFYEWLSKYNSVLLVAHNAPFDSCVLVNTSMKYGMSDKLFNIVGFVDTLKLSKIAYPGRRK
ncbi:uncharacterized protein LOC128558299 [Mercenaria mercenaria]|uniref:uncharacterized protein LOC128558299 n=1 Tax=Mercenaria mercenaria TaxID=6596 RepID=UPI00234FB0AF|nr:uncharacterized protein LOC128558299 [Mercenaria mercenaria]